MILSDQFADALAFAAKLHAEQFRKGSKIPYVSHLLAVTALVLEHGGNEPQAIAAILHDAVEDQGGPATAADIAQRFGPEVATLVEACTDTDQSPKPPWQARKQAYIDHLKHAPDAAWLIIGADKLHNMRSIVHDLEHLGAEVWRRFGGGREGSLWYFGNLTELVVPHVPVPLATEITRTMTRMTELAEQIH